jgi:DNA-binding SARP family transcriptional activator
VTSLIGGPGLGKTTLLAQAIAENRLAPRGDDIWIGVEQHDAEADRLARVLAAAVAGRSDEGGGLLTSSGRMIEPAAVAEAVWHRAPTEACIVLDDVHLLPPGSTGADWLTDLITDLPTNGHVVFASRSEPPVSLSRIGVQGSLLRLGEDDLRFSDEELHGFASSRGIDADQLEDTGGWPAMAELAASVEHRLTGAYLWEEVLGPLGTVRRHVLAVLSDLGGGDDELISAGVGTPVNLADALDGVPLVGRGANGWHVAHGLWGSAPGLTLDANERVDVRRRAIENLNRRRRFDEAFALVQDSKLWDAAPDVLRSACLATDRLVPTRLGRWLAASPDSVRMSLAGRLASGLHRIHTTPGTAREPLEEARARARDDGDIDAEMAAIAQLGLLAWWEQDLTALASLAGRTLELEPSGHPVARALAYIARGLMADMAGDDQGVLAEMSNIDSSVLATGWDIHAGWMRGVVHLDLGEIETATELVDRLTPVVEPAMRHEVDFLRLRTWWRLGRVDEVVEELPRVVAAEERAGYLWGVHTSYILASVMFAYVGDVLTSRRYLEDALASAPPSPDGQVTASLATARAVVELAEGDEPGAADTLRSVLDAHGLDKDQDRRAWRQILGPTYVLLPETRPLWDALPLRGFLRSARDLARVVVACRAGDADRQLRALDVTDLGIARAALHYRLAAELAVGLARVGRSEGRTLLELLGSAGRAAVRDVVESDSTPAAEARSARDLLSAVPAPPPQQTRLAVLGPLALFRDGAEEVVDPDLRRRRLQELVAFLVGHRRTNRTAISAAIWPDLDERPAANNLAVTLNHLQRLLEPWRDAGDPAYLLRMEGQAVHLVTGDHLRIDVDEFDDHVAAAARAEADGTPSLALEHDLAAVVLYRNQLHADLPEVEWFALDREYYRTRFVGAAVRAGQLLLSRGKVDEAETIAHRALAVDQWSEEAYNVLVGAALARRDRSGAVRILNRCLDAVAELGVDPSPATTQLQRRTQTVEA